MFGTNNPGESHGKQSPFRWDASTAAVALMLGALAFLTLIKVNVGASGNVKVGR